MTHPCGMNDQMLPYPSLGVFRIRNGVDVGAGAHFKDCWNISQRVNRQLWRICHHRCDALHQLLSCPEHVRVYDKILFVHRERGTNRQDLDSLRTGIQRYKIEKYAQWHSTANRPYEISCSAVLDRSWCYEDQDSEDKKSAYLGYDDPPPLLNVGAFYLGSLDDGN